MFWPVLFVAVVSYNNDNDAYRTALLEYSQGGNPDWYWKGLAGPETMEDVTPSPHRNASKKFVQVLTTLIMIPLIIFGLIVVVALISTIGS